MNTKSLMSASVDPMALYSKRTLKKRSFASSMPFFMEAEAENIVTWLSLVLSTATCAYPRFAVYDVSGSTKDFAVVNVMFFLGLQSPDTRQLESHRMHSCSTSPVHALL